MDKVKVCGQDHFIDRSMIHIIEYGVQKLTDGVYQQAVEYGLNVDKEKLAKWLEFCAKLECIDETELVDLATKRKFAEKDSRIESLETRCKNQAEWIANNNIKAKNCALQAKQLEKTITKLRQSNKDLRNYVKTLKQEIAELRGDSEDANIQ